MITNPLDPMALAVEIIAQAQKMLVLTGAGISVSAGIPCFTGVNSAPKPDIETRRKIIENTQPTLAHKILAKWETQIPNFLIATQNIDGLHQRASSTRVLEIHGNIEKGSVVEFGDQVTLDFQNIAVPFAMECDVCLLIGTSLTVFPASSLAYLAAYKGAAIIVINPENLSFPSALELPGTADAILEKLDMNWTTRIPGRSLSDAS